MKSSTQIASKQPCEAVSPRALKRIPAQEIVIEAEGDRSLEILVELPGFTLFRNNNGEFVVDCPIGIDISQDPTCGEYIERRQRRIVTPDGALRDLLLTVVPDGLLPLISELLNDPARAVRSVNKELSSESSEPTNFEQLISGLSDSLAERHAQLERGIRLFSDGTPQGRHVREMLYHLNRHEICRRELLSGE